MEEAAKRYARRILLVHLLVFVVLMAFVVFTARDVYDRTRQEAIEQARVRQGLLVGQTARGIEAFYQSIFNDMDLLRRAEEGEVGLPRPMAAPQMRSTLATALLWKQLQNRASQVFVFDKATGNVRVVGSAVGAIAAGTIVERTRGWLQSITAPALSKFVQFEGQGGFNLVCVPSGDKERVLVAAVPIRDIDARFLQEVNKQVRMGVTLLDESLSTMATSNASLVGMNILKIPDERIRSGAAAILAGKTTTMTIDEPIVYQGVTLQPAIINAASINLPGKTWWVYIATAMEEVDSVVVNVFRRAIVWAGIAIVGMTALLVSTAITLIRGRVRMERMRHEMLRKELDQARDIQLAWLPERGVRTTAPTIDLAAVNVPASHISGDFYNWFDLPDGRTVVTIGDVTGHGMSAAFLMATTQLLVRTTMPRVGDPGKCLEEVNHQLCVQVFNGQFVTMMILVLDMEQGVVDIATAGHPPPLVCEGGAYAELPVPPQLVMGIEGDVTYPTERFALAPESGFLLYTDGVPDAQSPDGDRLETAGLQKALRGRYESAQALLDATVRVVDTFRGPRALNDDLTLVAIQLTRTGVARPEAVGAGTVPSV